MRLWFLRHAEAIFTRYGREWWGRNAWGFLLNLCLRLHLERHELKQRVRELEAEVKTRDTAGTR